MAPQITVSGATSFQPKVTPTTPQGPRPPTGGGLQFFGDAGGGAAAGLGGGAAAGGAVGLHRPIGSTHRIDSEEHPTGEQQSSLHDPREAGSAAVVVELPVPGRRQFANVTPGESSPW